VSEDTFFATMTCRWPCRLTTYLRSLADDSLLEMSLPWLEWELDDAPDGELQRGLNLDESEDESEDELLEESVDADSWSEDELCIFLFSVRVNLATPWQAF
jgi:hypothetical protein